MTYRVRLMTLWTSCMMLCSANKCCRYLGKIVLKFYQKKKSEETYLRATPGRRWWLDRRDRRWCLAAPPPPPSPHPPSWRLQTIIISFQKSSSNLLILYHCAIKDDQRYMSRSPIKVRGSVRILFQTFDFRQYVFN